MMSTVPPRTIADHRDLCPGIHEPQNRVDRQRQFGRVIGPVFVQPDEVIYFTGFRLLQPPHFFAGMEAGPSAAAVSSGCTDCGSENGLAPTAAAAGAGCTEYR